MKLQLQTALQLPDEAALQIAADVWLPATLPAQPLILICLPGGAMTRRYFDLRPEGGDRSFSFAQALTARGFVVAAIDHLGVGESSRPVDGFALTPGRLAAANAEATVQIVEGLRAGTLLAGVAPMPALRSIGVGHSMGAMLTIWQQTTMPMHAGLAVLGFATRGLPEYVGPKIRERLLTDRAGVMRDAPALAKQMFGEPYPVIRSNPGSRAIYAGDTAEAAGAKAVKAALERLLPVPAFVSMLPDNVGAQAAQITVPVFIGVGENDMTGPPEDIARGFPASAEVTLEVLPNTGHNHFIFPERHRLFAALADWALNHLD